MNLCYTIIQRCTLFWWLKYVTTWVFSIYAVTYFGRCWYFHVNQPLEIQVGSQIFFFFSGRFQTLFLPGSWYRLPQFLETTIHRLAWRLFLWSAWKILREIYLAWNPWIKMSKSQNFIRTFFHLFRIPNQLIIAINYMKRFVWFGPICTVWKNAKNTHGRVILLVKL